MQGRSVGFSRGPRRRTCATRGPRKARGTQMTMPRPSTSGTAVPPSKCPCSLHPRTFRRSARSFPPPRGLESGILRRGSRTCSGRRRRSVGGSGSQNTVIIRLGVRNELRWTVRVLEYDIDLHFAQGLASHRVRDAGSRIGGFYAASRYERNTNCDKED